MSLTSELKNPNSAVSRFVRTHLPATERASASLREQLPLRPLTLRPQGAQRFDYRSLGRAIDRRLRVAFGSPVDSALAAGVAYAGADVAGLSTRAAGQAVQEVGHALLSELKGQPAASGGAMTRSGGEEERLARLCFVASHFEEIFRAGLRPGNPLLQLGADAGLDDLLGEVPSYVPGDIARQVELAGADHALGWVTRLPVDERICAPVFSGSRDVGGADADYIAGGCLIDCKATIRPDRVDAGAFHQLAGYLLLDYEDGYCVSRVGLYLSRQGQLIGWTAEEFLGLLGARQSLSGLRAAFRRALAGPSVPEAVSGLVVRRRIPRR
ncbi:hypothetical protein [Streptomyces fuscichromogenes]|uniref:Uncharacterized protein n=1 Tax=Streptomyces fuscichromogenes TaxID=1324013 RepID=A0A917XQ87_9ACTN|nr:hypothetical protein [Streptomyces fuscichromogenes]GGN44952.1 hypothetical protein GCM10011578_096390 [Streptomyces fuscichromogenes]